MARRKGKKEPAFSWGFRFPRIVIDTYYKRVVLAVFCFAAAVVLVLSHSNLAGPAGELFDAVLFFLFGQMKWLLSLFFVAIGFLLTKKEGLEKQSGLYLSGVFGVVLITVAFLGIVEVAFPERAGFLGKLIGSLKYLFGFWASLVVFLSMLVAGVVLDFWPDIEMMLARRKQRALERVQEKEIVVFDSQKQVQEPQIQELETQQLTVEELKEPKQSKEEKKKFQVQPYLQSSKIFSGWEFPPFSLLESDGLKPNSGDIKANSQIIQRTLVDFGIPVEMGDINIGPTVTQYTLKPAQGIKLSRIVALQNDLALALAAHPIRIEAPIPGKSLVGIEVPNRVSSTVHLRKLLEDEEYREDTRPLLFHLGRDVMGKPVTADLARMPHLMVAGATGSGKSVFIHSMIVSLLYRNPPQLMRFILIDPKRVELTAYNEIPYLLSPVITDGKKAILALKWAVAEMERRYDILLEAKSRDINSYNTKMISQPDKVLPFIIIFIDELADLMTTYRKDLEGIIIRLSQMARATGIHLVVSTQRPSVEVITGLIKANITARIAFQVVSQVDSRTILDTVGAEKLLGRGDLLFISADTSKPKRVQGPFVSEKEVERVTEFIKKTAQRFTQSEEWNSSDLEVAMQNVEEKEEYDDWLLEEEDELYHQAYQLVVESQKASASYLQRKLKVGYARAARLLDLLESRGVIGPGQGAKPREVYQKPEQNFSQFSSNKE